jgi:glyoxylase-like metal-dependent hydrolase (beta-lactamase superfamily II)
MRAINLSGGMIAWGSHYVVRPVVEKPSFRLYQVDRVARGCLSYLLLCNGDAAVIDPARHTDRYAAHLADKGARLQWVLDTHAHADHISSGRALANRFDVRYYLHPYDAIHPMDLLPPRIGYEPLRDGQMLSLGGARAEIIHVPGHTLGQVNVLVTDPDGEQYLFSGDNLFIQSFGRPDLGGRGKDWAPYVYDSIFGTIKQRVMNTALVLPGHYADFGEADSAGVYRKRLMALWRQNRALQTTDRDRFVAETLSRLPEFPSQYVEIKRANTGLSTPDEDAAQELELGKNICGLTGT